jgi:hypothetical protein
MIRQPEFKIGDRFNFTFNGEIENVQTSVQKVLAVSGVWLNDAYNGIKYFYELHEDVRINRGIVGKGYTFSETDLNRSMLVEPVTAAAMEVRE